MTFSFAFLFLIELILISFNEYVEKEYVLVGFLLLIPIFVAVALGCFYHGRKSTKSQRNLYTVAAILALVTIVGLYAWTVYYFSTQYEYDDYYHGFGDKDDKQNYHKRPKKYFIIEEIIIGLALVGLYIYFIVVCATWESMARS